MENNQNNQQQGENHNHKMGGMMCKGGMCNCGNSHMYLLKWLLKVVLLVIVFCFAYKMGELKGMLESRGDYGMMGMHRGGMMYNDSGYGMGGGMMDDSGTTTSPAVPATPAQ